MDYVIKNHNNVYIKLNKNGQPITCSKSERTLFEYSKAKNICDSLPKTLKKLNFKVEAIPDVGVPKEVKETSQEYKQMKINREKRRTIKDELLIVENVLKEINPDCMQRERVQKAIDGLLSRKYSFRIVEEVEENAVM